VVDHDGREEEETVKRLVERKKQEYPTPGQIIVYCDTVKKTERMAEILGCVCFHRNVGSKGEKAEILRQLTDGTQQVFTATNALGLGVDAPTIRVVVHVGRVRKLRDYAQESGRAGRDGWKSEAIILQEVRHDGGGKAKDGGSWMEKDMDEFVTTSGCRRVVMDRVMDGRGDRVGCEEDEEKCDGCQREDMEAGGQGEGEGEGEGEGGGEEEVRSNGTGRAGFPGTEGETEAGFRAEERGRERRGSGGQQEEKKDAGTVTVTVTGRLRGEFEREMRGRRQMGREEVEREKNRSHQGEELADRLEEWSIGCVLCHADGYEGYEGHRTSRCTRMNVERFEEMGKKVEASIRWADWSGCLECRVPQGICQRWKDGSRGWGWERSGGDCQYPGVMTAVVTAIWILRRQEAENWVFREMVKERLVSERDKRRVSEEKMLAWLGRKIKIGRLEGSRAYEMIMEIE
jgi:hypothetical protein